MLRHFASYPEGLADHASSSYTIVPHDFFCVCELGYAVPGKLAEVHEFARLVIECEIENLGTDSVGADVIHVKWPAQVDLPGPVAIILTGGVFYIDIQVLTKSKVLFSECRTALELGTNCHQGRARIKPAHQDRRPHFCGWQVLPRQCVGGLCRFKLAIRHCNAR